MSTTVFTADGQAVEVHYSGTLGAIHWMSDWTLADDLANCGAVRREFHKGSPYHVEFYLAHDPASEVDLSTMSAAEIAVAQS